MSLPGVAITISQPFSISLSWGPLGAPPREGVLQPAALTKLVHDLLDLLGQLSATTKIMLNQIKH